MTPNSSVADVLRNTDWPLFHAQKTSLVQHIQQLEQRGQDTQQLLGLLHWLDAMQDASEKEGYMPPVDAESTNERPLIPYDLQSLFVALARAFPQFSAAQCQQATFSAFYHQAKGEELRGISVLYLMPTLITAHHAYILWPAREEQVETLPDSKLNFIF